MRVPLGPGTRDLFETLRIAADLRELRLLVELFLRIEDARRRLPWRAADSCGTLGIFAVEVAREASPLQVKRRDLLGGLLHEYEAAA